MRYFPAIIVTILISGCGIADRQRALNMSDSELRQKFSGMSVEEICDGYRNSMSPDNYERVAMTVLQERDAAGDCSEQHVKCINIGYDTKTEGYRECRMRFEEMQSQERAAEEFSDEDPRTCTAYGNTVTCY